MKSFSSSVFQLEVSAKIFKDNKNNKISIIKADSDDSKAINENFVLLGDITKEGEKYYFVPFINELGLERDTIKDVPWMIYSKKSEPEINSAYYLKEGDILKLGNAIFKLQMIQMGNFDSSNNKNNNNYNNEENEDNNTLLVAGSSNHSLILNGQNNFENIEVLKTQKILVYSYINDKSEEKKNDKLEIKLDIKKEKITKNRICRICYQEEDDSLINPLIKPCKCSGSMKYIHIKCLLSWLRSRTIRHQNNVIEHNNFFNSYFITKEIQCELCKATFPDYIKHNHIKYCLIDFDYMQENKIKQSNNIPARNYVNTNNEAENNNELNNGIKDTTNNPSFIVLDTIYPLNDGNLYRCIVKFNKDNKIIIGRGLENQLVLNEITVSRTHCLLTLQKNKFGKKELKLEDDESKFATLILMQSNRYEIIKGKPLHIQIGNVYLVLKIPIEKSFLSCCNVNVLDGKNSYEKINSQAVKSKYKVVVMNEGNSDDENEKDNNSESVQNINIKNTENNINKINKLNENNEKISKEELKNDVEEEKKEKIEIKDEIILNETKKEDILILKDKAKTIDNEKKEEISKTENENIIREKEEDKDKDKDKRTVNIPIIKSKDKIDKIKEGNKSMNTTPENRKIIKNLLGVPSVKSSNKEFKKNYKESNKDMESIVVAEDESEIN